MPRGPAPVAPDDDIALLRRVAIGDSDALKPLYERFSSRALGVCMRVLRARSEAEEALQETFVEVWRRARDYEARRGTVEAWIATIARTRSIDRLRAAKSRQRTGQEAPANAASDPVPLPDRLAEVRQDQKRVSAALALLPPEQRTALDLAYFEGLSHSEIAQRTGDPLGTVKTRLRLAMEKLARHLK